MDRPKKKFGEPYYDLLELLKYIDEKVPRFKRKIWRMMCDLGYINNDTMAWVNFDNFITNETSEEIVEGIEVIYEEFPDIKDGGAYFWISW